MGESEDSSRNHGHVRPWHRRVFQSYIPARVRDGRCAGPGLQAPALRLTCTVSEATATSPAQHRRIEPEADNFRGSACSLPCRFRSSTRLPLPRRSVPNHRPATRIITDRQDRTQTVDSCLTESGRPSCCLVLPIQFVLHRTEHSAQHFHFLGIHLHPVEQTGHLAIES